MINTKNRHETLREPPKNQRPPRGNGWSRRHTDELGGFTVWRMWAPTSNGSAFQMQLTVTDLEIALAGRWTAAMRLRKARRELRLALVA